MASMPCSLEAAVSASTPCCVAVPPGIVAGIVRFHQLSGSWDTKKDTDRMSAQSLACEIICSAAQDSNACRRLVCLQCGPDDITSDDEVSSDSTMEQSYNGSDCNDNMPPPRTNTEASVEPHAKRQRTRPIAIPRMPLEVAPAAEPQQPPSEQLNTAHTLSYVISSNSFGTWGS